MSGEPLLTLRENDYVIDDSMKVGGNAQCIVRDRWLHHTSFLWDFDDDDMRYLALPQKRPTYRGDRTHSSFITRLAPRLPLSLRGDENSFAAPCSAFADELETELTRWFQVQEVRSLALFSLQI